MSCPNDIIRHVRQWTEKAEHDLRNAEHTLTLETDCPFDTACFHAQQCAEKYLKAVLVFRGTHPPKTHDLTELLPLAQGGGVEVDSHAAELLMPYAVESRYPSPEPYARAEAEEAIKAARRVRDAVRAVLPEEALSGS